MITFAVLFLMAILYPIAIFIMLGSAFWCAWDSTKIKLKRYKTMISLDPIILFFAISLLWIVGFPCYLFIRDKVQNGLVELKR